eukprot:COSAG05_NODE_21555_length_271_cov_0.593023_2_plen_27_part_01
MTETTKISFGDATQAGPLSQWLTELLL